ncbi:MAG: DUF120 domain-containing protein, partial [Syntrophobacterales bacterium]
MIIKGKIVRGVGESASFLAIPWVNRQMGGKLRFQPYGGTLNIAVADPEIQRALKAHQGDRLCSEAVGFCDALIFRGIIGNKFECGI